MPAANQTIFVDNDNLLTVDELTNKASGNFINNAVVTVTLLEDDLVTQVTGETWPLTVPYVVASNGKYQTTLSDTLTLVNKRRYFANVIADGGAGLRGNWTVPIRAITRFE